MLFLLFNYSTCTEQVSRRMSDVIAIIAFTMVLFGQLLFLIPNETASSELLVLFKGNTKLNGMVVVLVDHSGTTITMLFLSKV